MQEPITWRCHICGRRRPDEKISVQKNFAEHPGLGMVQENVRYCNDDPKCTEQAKTFTFFGRA